MSNKIDDRSLVEGVLAGDKQTFVDLINQYEGLVLHIVTPLVGVNEDREDICQEVFLKVYRNLPSFQFRSSLATWIGRIAYNASINYVKKKRPRLFSELVSSTGDAEFLDAIGDEAD